jgi:hypothetical protein
VSDFHVFLTPAPDRYEWFASRSSRFAGWERDLGTHGDSGTQCHLDEVVKRRIDVQLLKKTYVAFLY